MSKKLPNSKFFKPKSLEDRLNFFKNFVGFNETQMINSVPALKKVIPSAEDLLLAGKFIYLSAKQNKFSDSEAIELVSPLTLSILLSPKEDLENALGGIWDSIANHYGKHSDFLSQNYKLKITGPQALRDKVYMEVNNKPLPLNSVSARKIWSTKIMFSDVDLKKDVQIPTKIKSEDLVFLGIVDWAVSLYTNPKTGYAVTFSFEKDKELQLYQNVVIPILKNRFNLYHDKNIENERRIVATSQALFTYLKQYSGAGNKLKENRELTNLGIIPQEAIMDKKLTLRNMKKLYLFGLLSVAMKTHWNDSIYGRISNQNNPEFLKQIKSLASQVGYKSNLSEDGERLRFGKNELIKISNDDTLDKLGFPYYHSGGYINPAHFPHPHST